MEWSAQRRGGKGNSFSAVLHDKRWRTGEKYAEMTLLTPPTPQLPEIQLNISLFRFPNFKWHSGTPLSLSAVINFCV